MDNIARELKLQTNDVKKAITDAYTPDCLAKVDTGYSEIPLLEALSENNIQPHIWTVGDKGWQATKLIKSSAVQYVDKDHYHCSLTNKIDALTKIITRLAKKVNKIIVVDDKPQNILDVKDLANIYGAQGIQIVDFLMNLNDNNADGTALYRWLLPQMSDSFELILDFDGVVADTDSVLLGSAVDNLWSLINS